MHRRQTSCCRIQAAPHNAGRAPPDRAAARMNRRSSGVLQFSLHFFVQTGNSVLYFPEICCKIASCFYVLTLKSTKARGWRNVF